MHRALLNNALKSSCKMLKECIHIHTRFKLNSNWLDRFVRSCLNTASNSLISWEILVDVRVDSLFWYTCTCMLRPRPTSHMQCAYWPWAHSRNFSRSREQFMPYSDCLLHSFVTEISQSALWLTHASENNWKAYKMD